MLQQIHNEVTNRAEVTLSMLRLDLIHPLLSGNKWYKLKYNIQAMQEQGHQKLLTFGGAYSNHIYATAQAGKQYNLKTIGVIRGEETLPLNPILTFAKAQGMQLHYMDRSTYRLKKSPEVIQSLHQQFGAFYLVPEGGTNDLALQGTMEILEELPPSYTFDTVCVAVGTGGTIAGIIKSLPNKHQRVLGFPVLKGGSFLYEHINSLLGEDLTELYRLMLDYHFGGYAKMPKELLTFIDDFINQHSIPIEGVYTGKMVYGVLDLIQKGFFEKGARILMVHTGGCHLVNTLSKG